MPRDAAEGEVRRCFFYSKNGGTDAGKSSDEGGEEDGGKDIGMKNGGDVVNASGAATAQAIAPGTFSTSDSSQEARAPRANKNLTAKSRHIEWIVLEND
ncbi:hypothetical protein AC578_2350 [Pseudocercospora eumusae]|uniref:Uncharacterized protein n=1 Tax=Pseudocercospora eumusae TaxID=321146 RepID=A0A139HXH6_9PEZI|nr:hypothetical protein AC578_2350 [Pseudocercospora eumusae]